MPSCHEVDDESNSSKKTLLSVSRNREQKSHGKLINGHKKKPSRPSEKTDTGSIDRSCLLSNRVRS
jgi:hypothetical protein